MAGSVLNKFTWFEDDYSSNERSLADRIHSWEALRNIVDFVGNHWQSLRRCFRSFAGSPKGPCESSTLSNGNEYCCDKIKVLPHPSSSSCPTSCTLACHSQISSWMHTLSVHHKHIPVKLQEPFIIHGYFLPFMPWRYYLRGLYSPSYEFSNIWTHLLPCLYFLYLLHSFSKEMDIIHAWPLFLMTFSAIVICGFSAMAHLFHGKSSLHHSCWFVADYFGISLYAYSSMTTNFYSGASLGYYQWLSPYYLHTITIICFIGFTCMCVTQTRVTWISDSFARKVKVLVNGVGYAFGALPLFIRMYETSFGEIALQYHACGVLFMTIAPIIYGLDFPQCFFPGKFDIFGHSHMWFHTFSALSIFFDVHAVHYDIIEGPWNVIHLQEGFPTFRTPLFYYLLVVLYGIFCGHLIHCSVRCDYPEEEVYLQGKKKCSCGLPATMHDYLIHKAE